MPGSPYRRPVSRQKGTVSLRTLLILPFIFLIVIAVLLEGWVSFRSNQHVIDKFSGQFQRKANEWVGSQLSSFLTARLHVNQMNLDAVRLGLLNPRDLTVTGQYFWKQLRAIDADFIAFASADGEFISAERRDDGLLAINEISRRTGLGKLQVYNTDEQGNRSHLLEVKNWDPRTEPWYVQAGDTGKPGWSSVYLRRDKLDTLAIAATYPVYDKRNIFAGVLSVGDNLSTLNNLLMKLAVSPRDRIFIIEPSGLLVADSGNARPFQITGQAMQRLNAADSSDRLLSALAQAAFGQAQNLGGSNASQQATAKFDGQRYQIQAIPWRDLPGLDWLIVTAVPETSFLDRAAVNLFGTGLLVLLVLGVTTVVGIITARWVTEPLLRLYTAAQEIVKGNWDDAVAIHRSDEVGGLASAFNSLARQLKEFFKALIDKQVDLLQTKQELTEARDRLEAVLNAVPGAISWIDAQGVYLGVNRHLAANWGLPQDDFIGKNVEFLEGNAQFAQFARQFLADKRESASQEIALQTKNGKRHHWWVAAQKYQKGKATVSVGIDISERKKAEESLRIAEENYRSIFENALEGIFQSTPDGKFLSINRAMARIHGYDSVADMFARVNNIGEQLYVREEDRVTFRWLMQNRGEVKGFEYQAFRKDYSVIWVQIHARSVQDNSGKVLYFEGIVQDITERKHQEEQLRRQLEELRIEIDQKKRTQEVTKITQSDYFRELQAEISNIDLEEFWN